MSAKLKQSMCFKKVSFTTKAKAQSVAEKYCQRVYECPVCFCWHTTSKENWQDEFVTTEDHRLALIKQESQIRCELNAKNKAASQKVNVLEAEVKRLKHLLVENAKYTENEIAQSAQTAAPQAPAEEADTPECNHDYWIYCSGLMEEQVKYGKRCVKCNAWKPSEADSTKEAALNQVMSGIDAALQANGYKKEV